jgi:hypothetical protein
VFNRVDGQVDVEVGPVEMAGSRLLESYDRLDRGSLDHGYSSKGRNSSRSSMRSQKPCGDMFVTSACEVVVPRIMDFLLVFLHQLLDTAQIGGAENVVSCQLYCGSSRNFASPSAD